jgi:hypothetical protein
VSPGHIWGHLLPSRRWISFLIDVNPVDEQVFVGWYTYAVDGAVGGVSAQRWFSAQGAYRVGTTSMDLQLYVSTGGTFDSGGTVSTEWIGTATLVFASCSSAELDFEFADGELAGESGAVHLLRLGAMRVAVSVLRIEADDWHRCRFYFPEKSGTPTQLRHLAVDG